MSTETSPTTDLHLGRSASGHHLEDTCPCEKAPCGLAVSDNDDCPQHGWAFAKTMRQGHRAQNCPVAPKTESTP